MTGVPACDTTCTVDLFVENLGRTNYGKPHEFDQRKGLTEEVLLNDEVLTDWEIIALEFKSSWVSGLTGWETYDREDNLHYAPRVLKGELNILGDPEDTFFDFNCEDGCTDWLHGALFVNGFNMGRYFQPGPLKTLYIPGPFLKSGPNEVTVKKAHKKRLCLTRQHFRSS